MYQLNTSPGILEVPLPFSSHCATLRDQAQHINVASLQAMISASVCSYSI